MRKTSVVIADDHAIVRMGLASLLGTQDDFKVVGDAEDGEAVVRKAVELRPDVIIMDLMMPKKDGAAATTEIYAALPDVKIIVLTTFGTSDGIANALNAGATGALMKSSPNSQLIKAIRTVMSGGRAISEDVERLLEEDPPAKALTPRQKQVLTLYYDHGLTMGQIALKLSVNPSTVSRTLSRAKRRLYRCLRYSF